MGWTQSHTSCGLSCFIAQIATRLRPSAIALLLLLLSRSNQQSPRVTLFDFSQNHLASLPEMIDMMTAVRELRLDENVLEKLPRSLCSLSNLHRLSVTRNGLRAFPNQMHLMHSLRFLYLDDNELEAIPASIIRAQNLEEVSFCSNRIFEFPEGMPQLRKLRNLIEWPTIASSGCRLNSTSSPFLQSSILWGISFGARHQIL